MEKIFLVDTNAFGQVSQYRQSAFFLENVRIPEAVLDEIGKPSDLNTLQRCKYHTTISVLRELKKVMETIPEDDVKLVDLYANKGHADPLIIACALDLQTKEDDKLFAIQQPIIVTNDKAVARKATKFQIEVISGDDFKKILAEHSNDSAT